MFNLIRGDNMKNVLKYYQEQKTGQIYVYGEYYDFFRTYCEKESKWKISKLSYSEFLHDFLIKEIAEEEVSKITKGNLPTKDYRKYC